MSDEKPKRALVVQASRAEVEFLGCFLENVAGFAVTEALSGPDLIKKLRLEPDLILIDTDMKEDFLRMVEIMGGQSVLLHHMSYIDYDAFKHGEERIANERRDEQRTLFSRADHAFGVGPLLRDRLADLLGRSSADTSMLVPGLADIEPLASPVTFTAISFGRLDPSNDRIKQGRLAIAGFATAVRAAHEQVGSPRMLRDARMTVGRARTPPAISWTRADLRRRRLRGDSWPPAGGPAQGCAVRGRPAPDPDRAPRTGCR